MQTISNLVWVYVGWGEGGWREGNKEKIFQIIVCWNITQHAKCSIKYQSYQTISRYETYISLDFKVNRTYLRILNVIYHFMSENELYLSIHQFHFLKSC